MRLSRVRRNRHGSPASVWKENHPPEVALPVEGGVAGKAGCPALDHGLPVCLYNAQKMERLRNVCENEGGGVPRLFFLVDQQEIKIRGRILRPSTNDLNLPGFRLMLGVHLLRDD